MQDQIMCAQQKQPMNQGYGSMQNMSSCRTTAFAFGVLVIVGLFSIVVLQALTLKELKRKRH